MKHAKIFHVSGLFRETKINLRSQVANEALRGKLSQYRETMASKTALATGHVKQPVPIACSSCSPVNCCFLELLLNARHKKYDAFSLGRRKF